MNYILINTFPIICVVCSTYLMKEDKDWYYWCWFLALAYLSAVKFTSESEES